MVDPMSWADMRRVHELTDRVRSFASTHPTTDAEQYIRTVVKHMENVLDRDLDGETGYKIVLGLRNLVRFARTHRLEENDHEVIVVTSDIIKLAQGCNEMTENQLSEYVDRFYEMDPNTEDVLDNATLVVDGMKVLLENPVDRAEVPGPSATPDEISNARMWNRWATVTHSKISASPDGAVEFSFVAVYEDGTKRKRFSRAKDAWLVKKDTIPRIDTLMTAEGRFLEALPTKKMVAFLEHRMKFSFVWDAKQYTIQTGTDGDIIPLDQYLIAEGVTVIDDPTQIHSVVDKDEVIRYVGNASAILSWAETLSPNLVRKEEYRVGSMSLGEFIEEHSR